MPSVAELKKRRDALQGVRSRIDREEKQLAQEAHKLHKRIKEQHDAKDEARKRDDERRIREIERRLHELASNREDVRKELEDLDKREEGLVKRLASLHKRIKEKKRKREENDGRIVLSAGSPHWGGSDDIIRGEVDRVAEQFGLSANSRKRSATDPLTISNPSSDHSVLATLASAGDYGTYNGSGFAYAVARELGISGYSTGNYNGYTIYRAGVAFRVQILWAVSGHYDHVHVGIRRA